MWDSNGDLNHEDREIVDPGPMTVSGKIDGNSHVRLVCTNGSITVDGDIDGSSIVYLVSAGGPITIKGKIDGSAVVVLVSTTDSVIIANKCDGSSHTTIEARGDVTIGTQDEKKIDGSAGVSVIAGGNITLGAYIHSATVDFQAHGDIRVGELDGSAKFMALADGDITVDGKIDGSSRAELVSNRMSVTVNGKIDGSAKATLTAGMDVGIGVGQQGGDEDHKIDGNASVVAIANRDIALGSRIGGNSTTVDFVAGAKVGLGGNIGGGAHVRLLSAAKSIAIPGGIDGGGTTVETAPSSVAVNPTVTGGAQWTPTDWANADAFTPNPDRGGYWWQNWPHTFGYVAPFRVVPRSLADIVTAVQGTPTPGAPDATPTRAVGGGWSFTDASLPFRTAAEVAQASLVARGRWQRQDLRDRLAGIGDDDRPLMDLVPEMVGRNVPFSTVYDQSKLRQVTKSGPQTPASKDVRLIDTRSLASSLHCEFDGIRSTAALRQRRPKILFHVEAGITMADLQQLLDHQHPRLAIRASGGSPGATLAGALATATHGGEYNAPLLVDEVLAVHLVGPGGEQWWIEGDYPVADQAKLQARYPAIDPPHFIGGSWNAIPGVSAQDVLDAVVVSMGSIGVIYSMVIEVYPQFGLHQVVHPTSWDRLLEAANTTEGALHAGTATDNQAVLGALIDGSKNGTGIGSATNEYVDLAINPLNLDCWIVNREVTALPDDANSPAPAFGDYQNALTRSIQQHGRERLREHVRRASLRLLLPGRRSHHAARARHRATEQHSRIRDAVSRRHGNTPRRLDRANRREHGEPVRIAGPRTRVPGGHAQRLLPRARRDRAGRQLRPHRDLVPGRCHRLARQRPSRAGTRDRARPDERVHVPADGVDR